MASESEMADFKKKETEPLVPPDQKQEFVAAVPSTNTSMRTVRFSPTTTTTPTGNDNDGAELPSEEFHGVDVDAPEDNCHLVWVILLWMGASMLLTYNSFVAAPDYTSHYFKYAGQNEHLNATMPKVWEHISPFLTASNMVPNLFCQIAMLSNYVQSIAVMKRLYFAIMLNAAAMLMVPVAPAFKIDEHSALSVLLIGDAICGGATALLQSSAFAIAAQFPVSHMQSTMLGIGVSGTFVSLLQIITFAAFGSSFDAVLAQSSVFFGVGVLALVVLAAVLPLLKKNEFARYYVLEWRKADDLVRSSRMASPVTKPQNGPSFDAESTPPTLPDVKGVEPGALKPSVSAVAREEQHEGDKFYEYIGDHRDGGSIFRDQQDRGVFNPAEEDKKIESVDVMRILGICKWNMLANFFVYFVTLLVFPGMGVAVDPDSSWYGIIIVFLFNFGDFSGRMLCKFEMFLLKGRHGVLQIFSACRVLFVPLFLLSVKPKVITSNALPMIFMYLVGITNGFTSSQLMMFTPSLAELLPQERPTAGSAMSLSLLGGCAGGSLSALLLSQVYFD